MQRAVVVERSDVKAREKLQLGPLGQFAELVGGLNPSEKYWSIGMIIPNIWQNKKCSKPPTSYADRIGTKGDTKQVGDPNMTFLAGTVMLNHTSRIWDSTSFQ